MDGWTKNEFAKTSSNQIIVQPITTVSESPLNGRSMNNLLACELESGSAVGAVIVKKKPGNLFLIVNSYLYIYK